MCRCGLLRLISRHQVSLHAPQKTFRLNCLNSNTNRGIVAGMHLYWCGYSPILPIHRRGLRPGDTLRRWEPSEVTILEIGYRSYAKKYEGGTQALVTKPSRTVELKSYPRQNRRLPCSPPPPCHCQDFVKRHCSSLTSSYSKDFSVLHDMWQLHCSFSGHNDVTRLTKSPSQIPAMSWCHMTSSRRSIARGCVCFAQCEFDP